MTFLWIASDENVLNEIYEGLSALNTTDVEVLTLFF